MGNSDSKLVFKQGIFKLSSTEPIAAEDTYWRGFYELPSSPDDIFSLFTPADIRRARESSLQNLQTLIHTLTSRLFALRQHRDFPDPNTAPEKQALNCIRVLTRVLPFVYEDEKLEGWEDGLFWTKRRQKRSGGRAEVLFGEDAGKGQDNEQGEEEYEDLRPLGEELIDTLVDLLFYVGFTVPPTERTRNRVTYAIWQKGVGCTSAMSTSKEMESNRTEVLRLLLTLSSKSLYMPAHVLPGRGVKALTYLVTCPDKQLVLSLLCSQLNTALNYNPASWRVPYDHVVYKDPKQLLVTYSLQFLLTLLLYPIPENSKEYGSKNFFRHFLGRLHRLQDFEFMAEGMAKTLNQPLQISSSYLPGSQKSVSWAPEMIILFWETLQCNKRFRSFIIDGERGREFMILMLFYALEHIADPAKQGVVRMCVFVLQTLSTEVNFGKLLNDDLGHLESLPPGIRIAGFRGTYADFLIIGKLDAIYPSLLATINNIAPYLEHISAQACSKLLQLFASMSSPSFLLANETNHTLLQSLLESMNAIVEHQFDNNRIFVQGIFKYRRKFEALRSFTLDSGQEELERLKWRKKEDASYSNPTSPNAHSRNSSFESVRSPQSARSPGLSNVPENGAFAIGEDEDSDNETQETPSTPTQSSRTISMSSSTGEPLPPQLRGMSEKARGKLPAGKPYFSRQNSAASLSTHQLLTHASQPTTPGVFAPTPGWIDTWLSSLPLHTILTLLSYPTPPQTLPQAIEPSTPRIQLFEWTPLSLGWYESLLWGFIFAAEMVMQKGTVGVWNGTGVRLFRVQQEVFKGPSLMKPMGAVDAVGSRIVSGVQSLGIGGGGSGAGSNDGERGGAVGSVRDV
ncbi:MAG: hypothetical protein Q9163_005880 [Psora crenata]